MKPVEDLVAEGSLPWRVDATDMICRAASNYGLTEDGELRLMAAAPELYEALRLAYEETTGERIVVPKRGWIERARRALEKAGGNGR